MVPTHCREGKKGKQEERACPSATECWAWTVQKIRCSTRKAVGAESLPGHNAWRADIQIMDRIAEVGLQVRDSLRHLGTDL